MPCMTTLWGEGYRAKARRKIQEALDSISYHNSRISQAESRLRQQVLEEKDYFDLRFPLTKQERNFLRLKRDAN